MKHPNILKYIFSLEGGGEAGGSGECLLVTERVIPFVEMYEEMKDCPQWLGRGITQIGEAVEFLGKQNNFIHANLNIHSIFITPSGDWKLSGFQFFSSGDDHFLKSNREFALNIYPSLYSSIVTPPPELASLSFSHPFDIYQFASFVYEIFHFSSSSGKPAPIPSPIPASSKIPSVCFFSFFLFLLLSLSLSSLPFLLPLLSLPFQYLFPYFSCFLFSSPLFLSSFPFPPPSNIFLLPYLSLFSFPLSSFYSFLPSSLTFSIIIGLLYFC